MLTAYKNRVTQEPGFHSLISRCTAEEAEGLKIPPEEKTCDILIDEMTIQKNTELECKGGTLKWWVLQKETDKGDYLQTLKHGDERDYTQALNQEKRSKETATHVLQMLFLEMIGFRLPFAYLI